MSFRKSARNQAFTVIYNEVAQHETMSMEARGVLMFMLSLPEDWVFHKNWLESKCPGWGRDKLTKILKELDNLGYLIRTARRSEDGRKLSGWDWEVLAESSLTPDKREIRTTGEEVRENRIESDLRIFSKTENQCDWESAPTKETSITKKTSSQNKEVSKLVKEKSQNQNQITVSQSLVDRIMTQLIADGLESMGETKKHYALMKTVEFTELYPNSQSFADGCAYVLRALRHQEQLGV